MSKIHAVRAIYDSRTFDKDTFIQTSQPLYYACISCSFTGNLSEGVEHACKNQFKVIEKVEFGFKNAQPT